MIRYGLIEQSPLGPIRAAFTENGLVELDFEKDEQLFRDRLSKTFSDTLVEDQSSVDVLSGKLSDYFSGKNLNLEINIDWHHFNDFQRKVLQLVALIPPGEVRTYGQIAEEVGYNKAAARAVGRANATNPMPIVIPCHRVIGAKGELTGYGGPGGIRTKAWLLELEGYESGYQLALPIDNTSDYL